METWHILIYVFGAVGGGLAGMLFTAFLYFLACRFILKDPRTLSSILHIVFSGKFNATSSVFIKPLPNYKNLGFVGTKEQFEETRRRRLIPVPANEKKPIPVRTFVTPIPAAALTEPAKTLTKPYRNTPEVNKQPVLVQAPAEPNLVNSGIDNRVETIDPELLIEINNNYKIAKEFSGGSLVSLKTDIWDTSQRSFKSLPAKLQDELQDIYGIIKMLNNLVWFSTEFQRHSSALSEQYSNLLAAVASRINELIGNPMLKTR